MHLQWKKCSFLLMWVHVQSIVSPLIEPHRDMTGMVLWLQKKAFSQSEGYPSEIARRNEISQKSPTFMFWDLILRYEILILIFIRAHKSKNFSLYVEVLEELTTFFLPWIILITQDGCLSTSKTWSLCQVQSEMSFKLRTTGFYLKPTITFQQF